MIPNFMRGSSKFSGFVFLAWIFSPPGKGEVKGGRSMSANSRFHPAIIRPPEWG